MREIKFRVWDKDEKKMLYDGFCLIPTSPSWGVTAILNPKVFEAKEWFDCAAFDWADGKLMSGIYVPMQYIGLKDKNGKECYWDDWVTDGINPNFLVTPDYHLLARLSEIEFEIVGNKYTEVIGNLYENPELLDARKGN